MPPAGWQSNPRNFSRPNDFIFDFSPNQSRTGHYLVSEHETTPERTQVRSITPLQARRGDVEPEQQSPAANATFRNFARPRAGRRQTYDSPPQRFLTPDVEYFSSEENSIRDDDLLSETSTLSEFDKIEAGVQVSVVEDNTSLKSRSLPEPKTPEASVKDSYHETLSDQGVRIIDPDNWSIREIQSPTNMHSSTHQRVLYAGSKPQSIASLTSISRRSRLSAIESFGRKKSTAASNKIIKAPYFQQPFVSRRIDVQNLSSYAKPWLERKNRRKQMSSIIPMWGVVVGLALGLFIFYRAYKAVPSHTFRLILDEDFSNGTINPDVWNREVQLGGFGNGEFDWCTDSDRNAYIENGQLRIVPTLTEDVIGAANVLDGYTVDLSADGSCTSTATSDCIAISNSTEKKIIPPVQSARLTTKGKVSLKYGKIEVKAKLPSGDWMWPAIWMLPENNTYGPWPLSGEIDIMESRGNGIRYPSGGKNSAGSTLHWGPSAGLDGFFRTSNTNVQQHGSYADKFFTFGLEWTDKYIYTYINSHLRQIYYLDFDEPFFTKGKYPAVDNTNKTAIANPWAAAAKKDVAPFDQSFYLILNVAVGADNGYFPDGIGKKPWADQSGTAEYDFYTAKDVWYPSWPSDDAERGMIVESVKIWELAS